MTWKLGDGPICQGILGTVRSYWGVRVRTFLNSELALRLHLPTREPSFANTVYLRLCSTTRTRAAVYCPLNGRFW